MSHFPQRVVSLQPSVTSTLAALGVLERLVACTKYCIELCPETRDRFILHDSWTAQAEQIAPMHPDLVIASVPYQEKAITEILKSGVPVLLLSPRTLADIYSDIAMIAGVMAVPERAAAIIDGMKSEIQSVREQTRGLPRPRVFCEEWGKPIIASQPWVAELIDAAGGQPIGDPGKTVTADFVRDSEPDVLLAAWCGAGNRVPLEKIVRDRQWLGTPAGRNARVYCINDELLNTPGPCLTGGLRAISHALRPDLFPTAPGIRAIGGPVLK